MLDGIHVLNLGLGDIDHVDLSWDNWKSLCADLLTSFLGISLEGVVLSYSFPEGFIAARLAHMLNSDMDSLGNDLFSDLFVHNDTNGMLIHVKYSTGSSVVELVGHTLVDATVSNDINEISLSVGGHNTRE